MFGVRHFSSYNYVNMTAFGSLRPLGETRFPQFDFRSRHVSSVRIIHGASESFSAKSVILPCYVFGSSSINGSFFFSLYLKGCNVIKPHEFEGFLCVSRCWLVWSLVFAWRLALIISESGNLLTIDYYVLNECLVGRDSFAVSNLFEWWLHVVLHVVVTI
jgi:hypothetical protein